MRNGRHIPNAHAIMQSGNLYMFTIHDPVNFVDPTGLFAITLTSFVIATIVAVVTTAILATDYAMHGSNSVVGQAATGIANTASDVLGGGIAIPSPTVAPTTQSDTRARSEPIVVPRTNDPPRTTPIYRSGSGNATNMTPRAVDVGGLSFYLSPPATGSFTATTIEAVNATGVLRAVVDGTNHVSVVPVNPLDMPDWIASRYDPNAPTHALTHIMMAITIRGR